MFPDPPDHDAPLDELCMFMKEKLDGLDGIYRERHLCPDLYDAVGDAYRDIMLRVFDTLGKLYGADYAQVQQVIESLILHGLYKRNVCGVRILDYDEMLYPYHAPTFTTVDSDTLIRLREEARRRLAEWSGSPPELVAHLRSIAEGEVPFGMTERKIYTMEVKLG